MFKEKKLSTKKWIIPLVEDLLFFKTWNNLNGMNNLLSQAYIFDSPAWPCVLILKCKNYFWKLAVNASNEGVANHESN